MAIVRFEQQRFDYIYEKYADLVYRVSYHYLLNKEDAEDIVQDVFVKYLTHKKKFVDDNHERAWMLRVTANLCKNVLRSKSRQNLQLNELMKIGDVDFSKAKDSAIDLENSLSSLTANQRMAIQLFYFEQISIKEIAKIMKSNENTVKSHLSRAKNKLKINLERE